MERVNAALVRVQALPQGGTAVGTGINAPEGFGPRVAAALASHTKVPFTAMDNYFEGLSSQDAAVELSGQLRTVAVSLMKIANDLRWMNSGPLAGIAEIALPQAPPVIDFYCTHDATNQASSSIQAFSRILASQCGAP